MTETKPANENENASLVTSISDSNHNCEDHEETVLENETASSSPEVSEDNLNNTKELKDNKDEQGTPTDSFPSVNDKDNKTDNSEKESSPDSASTPSDQTIEDETNNKEPPEQIEKTDTEESKSPVNPIATQSTETDVSEEEGSDYSEEESEENSKENSEEENKENSEDDSEEDSDTDSNADSESDDDGVEIEPRLKYSRITTLPKPVFNTDPVSACILSETFIAVATHGGFVYIYKPDLITPIWSYRAHKASVFDLATDGYYVGSASMDGTVVIGSVTDQKDIQAFDFHRPVQTLALDPHYKSSKIFISGGMAGDVILSERGWLNGRSDTVIQHSEDPVTAVYWIESLIICMDESGINVYGQHSREKLLHIDRPKDSPRADVYKPRLCSPESNRIYIAWVDRIWNLKISSESALAGHKTKKDFFKSSILSSGASMILPSSSSILSANQDPQIIIESIIQIDSLVAGISPFGQDTLMILSYKPVSSEDQMTNVRSDAPPPEIRLIDLSSGEEVYADELSLKGYEKLGLNDYHLLQYSDESSIKYFIISAKDGVVAVERTLGDRINWLLEHKSYQEAWDISANVKTPEERLNIGVEWAESLLNAEKWEESANTLKKVIDALLECDLPISDTLISSADTPSIQSGQLADNSLKPSPTLPELTGYKKIAQENWNRWGFIFFKSGHSSEIAAVLPTTSTLQVDHKVYEQILAFFIDHDMVDEILKYIKLWPCDLYDANTVKFRLEFLIKDDYELSSTQKKSLQKSLADLYIASGDPASAVNHLLALHDESVLDLVSQYHLLPTIKDRIPDLLTVSLADDTLASAPLPIIRNQISKANSIVVKARHEVIPEEIVSQIMKRNLPIIAFLYLEQLTLADSFASQSFGDLQVSLYAEFDRPKLMNFLKKHNNYNLEKASSVCEKRGYIPELVYILGKIGQNKQALKLVIEKLKDPEQAIDFAKAQKDPELWDDLIDYCLERPEFIRVLLKRASGSVDPIKVLNKIPSDMKIPGIRDSIMHIFSEYELVLSLNKGILEIVQKEAQDKAKTLFSLRTSGVSVDLFPETSQPSQDEKTTNSSAIPELDFTGSIVIKPDGTLINEIQLFGDENVKHLWPQASISPVYNLDITRTVSQKIKHLAYIKKMLQSQLTK
ncbi:uncharacterized protein SAPINGB_P001215 [Magnusiomyces paraingens]|uniref:Vps41 beta-propeller domain-containing protein n=1 Tax=Magnusiomyces paraingens TaxID=2606893 RepID=A0A5E8B4K1_9ASCO|nr:uncharacterized protein SAPINGB_P001215 [Saprochaete ingens]VVT46441.1 unnamed protein product [Saprochaete ingens]